MELQQTLMQALLTTCDWSQDFRRSGSPLALHAKRQARSDDNFLARRIATRITQLIAVLLRNIDQYLTIFSGKVC
jgi:hypothetical protein